MKATKRMHISLGVEDLHASIRFYTAFFGASPTAVKDDYAKWMLDDPRVNFSISSCCGGVGLSHLGVQVENGAELGDISARLQDAGLETSDQRDVTCCYARQDKSWVSDPQGIRWETFLTHDQNARSAQSAQSAQSGCCA